MSELLKLKCVDPTKSLTEGKVYTARRTIEENGMHNTHFVAWEKATHVLLNNDSGETIRTLASRFKKVDEQEESKATTEG